MAYMPHDFRCYRGLSRVGWMVSRWPVDNNTGLSTIKGAGAHLRLSRILSGSCVT